jgi:hypothetical protein
MSAFHPILTRRLWLVAAWLCVSMSGCAYFWDDVTSKDFKVTHLWKKEDPMEVLLTSTDNYKRARAITELKEPKQHGGSDKEQERILTILQKTAQGDADPYCRLAAISTLGRFQDPKCVDILERAFHEKLPYDSEKNVLIRKQILVSMSQKENPKALQHFMLVARQPAGVREAPTEAAAIRDERMTAVRALAKYNTKEVAETLVHLMETERDISLKACAHASLQQVSGKDMPADPKLWREFIATGKPPKYDSPSWFAKQRDKYFTTPYDKGVLAEAKTKDAKTEKDDKRPSFLERLVTKPDGNKSNVQPVGYEKKDSKKVADELPPPQFPATPPAPLPETRPAAPTPPPAPAQLIAPGQPLPAVVPNSSLPLPPPAVPSALSGQSAPAGPTTPPPSAGSTLLPQSPTPSPSVPSSMGPFLSPPQ